MAQGKISAKQEEILEYIIPDTGAWISTIGQRYL